jgi:undecaprenyl-diphosphatase
LGLLHGATELLPVSSSAHTTLVPWLLGWPYRELDDPQLRKGFEVALHAGTAAALLTRPPGITVGGHPPFLLSALAPPALAGYALGGKIERRLGTPATIAVGLIAGSVAMVGAEVYARVAATRSRARVVGSRETTTPPGDPGGGRWASGAGVAGASDAGVTGANNAGTRRASDAGARDGLALGVAQSLALAPGVSRGGATVAAARARGFSREDSDRLSWQVGLPVIAGATFLEGMRLARGGVPSERRLPLAAGTASAFASTLLSARLLGPRQRAALLPACVVYRGVLVTLVVRRMRDNTGSTRQFSKK